MPRFTIESYEVREHDHLEWNVVDNDVPPCGAPYLTGLTKEEAIKYAKIMNEGDK